MKVVDSIPVTVESYKVTSKGVTVKLWTTIKSVTVDGFELPVQGRTTGWEVPMRTLAEAQERFPIGKNFVLHLCPDGDDVAS